ncbi:adenosine kinase [Roseospira marina]|uniref:Adenosine kinase n=1 Tax=Roseospira marina TaxID=140057 RepID=A0A5M6IBK0_9PROT|nr:adenosine kinase [Roseospira marina]KAA5605492.1 adenosine kinase [Roseospira marina]MBB4314505.1 sugar/nucleoside kinase (ribokinase family) [Roseospira marina]MBB5088667.1 sugar/nucleoside kinase (ribokinase family) [Roseospira marina]
MTAPRHDVVALGNAIVDVHAHANESFLAEHGMNKGGMMLIDRARAAMLYDAMGPGVESSGGSAANTVAGLASLGARAAFVGKVAEDQLGQIFTHDIRAIGAAFDTPPLTGPKAEESSTARCLILVTPDGQRTMNTYLGACIELGPEDIDEALFAGGLITYIEGYLWDPPRAKDAIVKAAAAARDAGRKVALTLSDSFCVDRHRETFIELTSGFVNLLFANEAEIKALYQTDDLDQAVAQIKGHTDIAAITRSEKGSLVVTGDEVLTVPAEPIAQVMDTTGAGDLYAAGFLRGLTSGRSLADCAHIGHVCAAEIISHFGPRPEVASLADLVSQKMGRAA